MLREKIFRSKVLSLIVIGAFIILLSPVEGLSQETKRPGTISGTILKEDTKTPIEGAIVKIRNVETEKEYQSAPTNNKGEYKIENVEEGRYTLGITTKEGDFNFQTTILVKADETAILALALAPAVIAGLAGTATAAAVGGGILAFFSTTAGIAVLVATGSALTLGTLAAAGAFAAAEESPAKKKKKNIN